MQPSYLCVQFVRFYWKQGSDASGTEGGKAKILRSVSFPKTFDIFEFCSNQLKASLEHGREFERKQRAEADTKALTQKDGDVEMKDESKPEEESKEEKKQLVGKEAKAQRTADRIKKEDEILYRPHG